MVNTYKLKLTLLQQNILRYLFIKAGSPVNIRNISRFLGVSQPAVSKSLPYLEKEELILVSKDKESKRFSIEANRDNSFVINLKRVDNLRQIYDSGMHEFLIRSFPGALIILFGSYAFGEDNFKSDIDIAVFGQKQKEVDFEKFEKILGREMIINYYSSLKNLKGEIKNNILNGIVLNGAIQI